MGVGNGAIMLSVIQWIADTTEFFKELGPLVTELTKFATLLGVLITVVIGALNRSKLNHAHDENTKKLNEIKTVVNGVKDKVTP